MQVGLIQLLDRKTRFTQKEEKKSKSTLSARADKIKHPRRKNLIAVIENPEDIRNIGTIIRNGKCPRHRKGVRHCEQERAARRLAGDAQQAEAGCYFRSSPVRTTCSPRSITTCRSMVL